MNFFSIIGGILSSIFSKTVVDGVVNTAKDWWTTKQQMKQIELQSQLAIKNAEVQARIERIKTDQKLYADSDQQAIAQWKNSWMDEILILTIVFLVLSCFVPGMQTYIENGVKILNNFPIWLQVIIGGAYISILGLRFVFLAPIEALFNKGQAVEVVDRTTSYEDDTKTP